MQGRINNYLNQPFPLFLSYRQGRIYFIVLIIILAFFLNVFQPFGLTNWHAFHKSLFLSAYSLVYVSPYAFIYLVYSWLCPAYFRRKSWTIRRELHILSIYIPLAAFNSWAFTYLYVEELEFSLGSFLALQFYNSIVSVWIFLGFGYFVSTKLKPVKQISLAVSPASGSMIINEKTVDITEQITMASPPPATPGFIILKKDRVDVSTILFAESRRNNLYIYTLQRGKVQELKKIMTLKAFAELVTGYPYMKRCYASYIVNINQIELWSGTLSKMTLYLKGCNQHVPVSDTYTSCFKEIMNELEINKR
jgi:hypothetical protein